MADGRKVDRQGIYQIRVRGILDEKWSDWFDGFTIIPQGDDETLLIGPVADQAALHGLLGKIRDLGLPLLSVERVKSEERPRTQDSNRIWRKR
jgi:hypothetical protein